MDRDDRRGRGDDPDTAAEASRESRGDRWGHSSDARDRDRSAGERRRASPAGDGARATGDDGNERLLAVLAHVVPFPFEALFFVVDDDSEFVHYHTAHSLSYSIVASAGGVLLGLLVTVLAVVLPLLLSVVGALLGEGAGAGAFVFGATVLPLVLFFGFGVAALAFAGLWLYFVVAAATGKRPRVPVVSRLADVIQDAAGDGRREGPPEGTPGERRR